MILIIWPDKTCEAVAADVVAWLESDSSCAGKFMSLGMDATDSSGLSDRISDCYRRLVNLSAVDTTLHVIAVTALFDPAAAAYIGQIAAACRECPDKVSLHIVGLRRRMARVLGAEALSGNEELEVANIRAMASASVNGPMRFSYTLIDDYAASGAAIAFSSVALAEYIAMVMAAFINSYHSILAPAILAANAGENMALGVAALRFDSPRICSRFMHRAFVAALDRAGICRREVNTALVARKALTLLSDVDRRYPRFVEKNVLPLLRDSKMEEDDIVAVIGGAMTDDIDALGRSLTSFLDEEELTLPEKEGVLAMMLGRDNPRLRGVCYDRDSLLLDDACTVPFELYIDAFNRNIDQVEGLLPVRGDFEALRVPEAGDGVEDLSAGNDGDSENRKAFNPLPDIKRLKTEIINTTAFIRRKSDELESLARIEEQRTKAENSENAMRPSSPRTVPEVKEEALDEYFRPSDDYKAKPSVDLRPFFSPVKNQGRLGACTTYALVSIYESIMNRIASATARKADMSEQFVYFHSNIAAGRPGGGSNYREQIAALSRYGVCHSSMYSCPDGSLPASPPTAEAMEDASAHRVVKALQLPLRSDVLISDCVKENHRLITAALSQGYPVGIALRVFDDFGADGPFIGRPDETGRDIAEASGHAMVVVGYSEKDKCYIVRNSWGSDFGDKGYCYVSAAYVDDPAYNDFACIITETTDSHSDSPTAEVPALVAPFAGTETQIRMAAVRNVIDEAYVILRGQQAMHDELYKYYQALVQRLCMPQIRTMIRKAEENAEAQRLLDIRSLRRSLLDSFVPDLKAYKRSYKKMAWQTTAAALALDIPSVLGIVSGKIALSDVFYWIFAAILTLVATVLWMSYKFNVRRRRRELDGRLADIAQEEKRVSRELEEKQLHFHVAGMWIDRFHSLSIGLADTYNRLLSFNTHLLQWYGEDSGAAECTVADKAPMIVDIEDADLSESYFMDHISEILPSVDLLGTFRSYAVDSESISEARERLRGTTREAISRLFGDFNMAEYLMGRSYPYLRPRRVEDEIARLLTIGQPSSRHSAIDPPAPLRMLFTGLPDDRIAAWQSMTDQYFPYRPLVKSGGDHAQIFLLTLQPLPVDSCR